MSIYSGLFLISISAPIYPFWQIRCITIKIRYDFMKDAHEAGVKFKVCTPTLELWGEDLIPEIEETVGGAYVIAQAMDDDVVTFTY